LRKKFREDEIRGMLATVVFRVLYTKTQKTILSVVLCRCESWCLTIKEEHRLKVFKNRELKWWEAGEDCIMRSFITCMLQ
jgi:hypothetical protein